MGQGRMGLDPVSQWPERLSSLNREVMETAAPGKYLVDAIPARGFAVQIS